MMASLVAQLQLLQRNSVDRSARLRETAAAFETLAAMLERIQSQIVRLRSAIDRMRMDAHKTLRGAEEVLRTALEGLAREIPNEAFGLREDFDELGAKLASLQDRWTEQLESIRSQLEDAEAEWGRVSASIREEIPEEAAAALEELRSRVQENLVASAEGILSDSRERVTSMVENSHELAAQSLEDLLARARAMLASVISRVEERLVEGLRGVVDSFIDRAIGETLEDVAKGLITAQMSVSVATSTSALTPQIIALRPLVGQIKAVMEATG